MGKIGSLFLTAGHAIFTVSNPKGERYTFKITRKDPEEMSRYQRSIYFAALLTGPDNTSNYTYMGVFDPATEDPKMLRLTKASKYTADSLPVRVFNWAVRILMDDRELPIGYSVCHEGYCGRCGRLLTVPESVESGFGPECVKLMGGTSKEEEVTATADLF